MRFFMPMVPPTITAQEKKMTVKNSKPVLYEPAELKDAREKLTAALYQHRPKHPLTGPLWLGVQWLWKSDKHPDGEYKVTKPDTDNLQKMLKDCMTRCGYWNDDAQVCIELIEKRWTKSVPGIHVKVEQL